MNTFASKSPLKLRARSSIPSADIRRRVQELGPWFHNLDLDGIKTAPSHPLGDYPRVKWRQFANALEGRVEGRSVLDIGCNAGFYSIEMKRLGARRVLGIDSDERYLRQARFAANVCAAEIEFRQLSVYEIADLRERFDVVLFMGVLYHLRHPLLALDLISQHTARDLFVFQSMLRGSPDLSPLEPDYDFWQTDHFDDAAYPKLHFIERRYADDPTNWWVPNRACAEAMLRSSGFQVIDHPEAEVYICRRAGPPAGNDTPPPMQGRRP